MSEPDSRISVVIITRNRREELLGTLARLVQLPEQPRIVVVDNASTDGTAKAIVGCFPQVEVIEAGANRGAAGRNLGVERVDTPYVAFCDDDSWPQPGALRHAASVFDACPKLGLLCGRSLLGPAEVEDPICGVMEHSPLVAESGMPGPPLLGFVACAAVVRREAYRAAAGFVERFRVGGEEELLAVDLTAAGWWVCYDRGYVVHHHPSPLRSVTDRRAAVVRNALWAAWLRRSLPGAARRTRRLAAGWALDRTTARGVAAALAGLPWVLRRRRVVPPHVEAAMEIVEA